MTRRREILTRLAEVRRGGFKAVTDFAQELAAEDKDLAPVLTVIASWYRDALRRRVLGADGVLHNADLEEQLPSLPVEASLRNLESTYGTLTALRQNANRNLALVRMLLQLS